MGCLVIGCLKGYKRDLDFIKHRILLKRMQQEFRPETLLFYKGIDADYDGSQTISIRMEK
jgi:hypothetical protein